MCYFLFVYFVCLLVCNRLNNFDGEEDKFMAILLNYRGDVKSKEANATVQWLKNNEKCTFVEVGLNERLPALVQDDIGAAERNVTMIGNNHLYIGMLVKVWRKMNLQKREKS